MEVTRIFDILEHYLECYPNQDVALAKKKKGEWKKFSIQDYVDRANAVSYALLKLGVQKGDRVGLISGNRPEWNIVDFAIMQIGAVSVPIYPTISREDYKHILNHAEMKIIFIEGRNLQTKIEPIISELDTLEKIYVFDELKDEKYERFDTVLKLGEENKDAEKLSNLKKEILPNELATIIYTSGTTGVPKGVMLSHDNLVSQIHALKETPAKWSKKAFSFLPLCHAYERMLVYLYQYLGMSVYYAESLGTIVSDIKEINPTMMSCVPRVLEKIYDKLYLAGEKMKGTQKKLYFWAFNLATQYRIGYMSPWLKAQLKLADKLVYKKWREAIGGNFDIVVSGGSAIQTHIAAFFSAIGMPVFEGYGLSETSPVIAVSKRGKNGREFGTVGPPLDGVEVKLAEQNEIVCRGHNVMLGYYKNPELTKEVIDEQGWFHTGDIGKFNEKGQLIITGRLKSLFKTSFGKYINPIVIESKFTESPMIENMIVLGENEKFAVALIRPDFEYLKTLCSTENIPDFQNNEDAINRDDIYKIFQDEVKKYNANFADYEQIKRFDLVSEEWTPNNFLSPTLKTKRRVVEEFYKDKIEKLFR